MNQEIYSHVQQLPIFDVHEHHMPQILRNPNVGLIQLFEQSYAGWTQQRPYPLPSERENWREPPQTPLGQGDWRRLKRYIEDSGSNTFVRNLIGALSELYDLGEDGINEKNWRDLDREIQRRHAEPAWADQVLDRAKIRHIIADPYEDPLLDVHQTLGPRYHSVLRINCLAVGWHPQSRDHNGNSAAEFAERLGCKIHSYDDYMAMLETALDTLGRRHQVAIKNALAYDRIINYDDPDEKLARQAWGKTNPPPVEQKAFGDVVVNRLCLLAGQRNIPVQMHLGLGLLRGTNPMQVAGLIERHPRTRFLLMHLGYPWCSELLGLAFIYRNVWIDLTWSWLISPTRFKRVLREAIEVLPDESRLMLGGDCWHVEESFGAMTLARKLISDVLGEKIALGYFKMPDAQRLAAKIFHQNAAAFFGLE